MLTARLKNKLMLTLVFVFLSVIPVVAQDNSTPALPAQTIITNSTQDKISLDVKGMDIVDVLKTISNRSGMNLIIGKNVTGKITLFLKNVDMLDVFEIILFSNELAYTKEGSIINVMTQKDYELAYGERFQDKRVMKTIHLQHAKAADLARALNQVKTNTGRVISDDWSNTIVLIDSTGAVERMEGLVKKADVQLETRVFGLNYASVNQLTEKLQETISKGVGSIKKDERTNKIIITDFSNKLDEIGKIITAFDDKTPQVLIDAQIIELTPSNQFQMGVDFDYWIKKYFEIKYSLPINTANALLIGTHSSNPTRVGQYKAIVDLLSTIGDTKILSSPRIMALNNQEAKILVGTKEAYITSTISQSGTGGNVTSQTVNFVDVGLKLYVTPTINRDGFITMKIRPEVSSSENRELVSEDQKTEVPIVTTSEAETSVMVKDGVTIIIGGLKKDSRTKTVRKIPFLGDIPILGNLFKSTDDLVKNTQLIILLTPHIMSGEVPYTEFDEVKPKEGAVFKYVKGNIVTEKISSAKQAEIINSFPGDKVKAADYYKVADYYQLIADKVRNVAKLNAPKEKKGEVVLTFKVSQKGNLLEKPEIINSTDSSLIDYALKAVKQASPFGPFPKEMAKTEEMFKIVLSYE